MSLFGGVVWITLQQKKQLKNGTYQIDEYYSIAMLGELRTL